MNNKPVLTIAVPIYNMERWLEKNLETYRDKRLCNRLEVFCVNNASEDSSKAIAEKFCRESPDIFHLIDREVDDYGAAVNDALAMAGGAYFRIVDSDDWVDTKELVKLVDALETCSADVVLTDYQIVNMQTGAMKPIRASEKGIDYKRIYTTLDAPIKTLPSIHATTYRTAALRDNHFYMQNGIFFVDEEYVVLPYLHVRSVVYYPYDIYRYQVANPQQSMSPANRARFHSHREMVLRRLLAEYHVAERQGTDGKVLAYCRERIGRGVGDHFTTLYMYIVDRRCGRELARQWKKDLLVGAPEFWQIARRKAQALYLLNVLHISLSQYERMKRVAYECQKLKPHSIKLTKEGIK